MEDCMDRAGQSRSPIGGRRTIAEYAETSNRSIIGRRSGSPEIEAAAQSAGKPQGRKEPQRWWPLASPPASSDRCGKAGHRSAEAKGTSGSRWTSDFSSRLGKALRSSPMTMQPRYRAVVHMGGGAGSSKVDGSRQQASADEDDYFPSATSVSTSAVKVWFGSYLAATRGRVAFAWRVDEPTLWKLTLSELEGGHSFSLRRQHVADISACLSHHRPLLLILPTGPFCSIVRRQLQLQLDKLDVFDVESACAAHKFLCLDLADAPHKSLFVANFERWQNAQHNALRVRTMEEEEASERLEAAQNAKKNMVIEQARQSQDFSALADMMEDQMFFPLECLALGIFEKRHCLLEVSISRQSFFLYVCCDLLNSAEVGHVAVPWSELGRCRYCLQYQIATFELASAFAKDVAQALERMTDSGGLRRDIQKSRTQESNSVKLLRLHFSDVAEQGRKTALADRLKLAGWQATALPHPQAFAYSVFPTTFKNFGRPSQERSTIESSMSAVCKTRLLGPNKAPSTKNKYASVMEEAAPDDSNCSLFSLSSLPATARPQQKRPPKVHGPANKTALANGAANKRAKCWPHVPSTAGQDDPAWVDLDGDENMAGADESLLAQSRSQRSKLQTSSLTNASLNATAAPHILNGQSAPPQTPLTNNKLNPRIKPIVFPKIKSVLEDWEERREKRKQGEDLSKRAQSRNGQRNSAKRTDAAAAAAASTSLSNTDEDCIVLVDSDNDEEEERHVEKQAPRPNNTNVNTEVDLPEDCHPAFRSVPIFEEVILGNSSIAAGDIYQLATGQQLGDGIVQFMIEFVRLRLCKEDDDSFHLFSYYFFQTYLGTIRDIDGLKMKELPEKVRSRLREHTRKIDIFKKQYLVVPVLNEQHWYLAVIYQPGACLISKKCPSEPKSSPKTLMVLFDSLHSLGSADRHKFTFNLLQRWLEAEAKSEVACRNAKAGFEEWQLDSGRFARFVPKSPQQQNGVDCGVFMINGLTHMVHHKPLFPTPSHNRIAKPDMDSWFPNDAVATHSMRLHMLHCYLTVASIKQMFVYRDDLIPAMIKDLGKEAEPFMLFPTEAIHIDSSPVAKPPAKRQADGDLKEMEAVCAGRQRQGRMAVMSDSPLPCTTEAQLEECLNLLECSSLTPRPQRLTEKQLDFFRRSGYRLPKELPSLRGEGQKSLNQRKELLAQWKEGQRAKKDSWPFIRKNADEIYQEFVAGKGALNAQEESES